MSVLTANANDLFNGTDIAETLDLQHLGIRIQAVLQALNDRSPAVPNYAPDIVLLQEVTEQSATTAVNQLSVSTGKVYRIAANALPGTGAYESHETPPYTMRETAIAYNTATMSIGSSPAASLLTYLQSDIPAGRSIEDWTNLRQSTILLKQISSGRSFGVYSAHYRPDTFVNRHDEYTVSWTNFLKKRIAEIYPGATPVIGGDFNSAGAFLEPFRTATTAGPGTYNVARPSNGGDAIASTLPILTTNYDYDYKTYVPNSPTYFVSRDDFLNCDKRYNVGTGSTANAINGCTQRYYSDHAFLWAVFGS